MAKNKSRAARTSAPPPQPVVPPFFDRYPFIIPLALLAIPFIYLYPYILPFNGLTYKIGNDFACLYFSYKLYLLDELSHFHIPLWSPSEAAGFPFYSNPFTQTFYPLNIILTLIYRWAGGFAEVDYERFTVFGISIFCVGLYCWLRALKLGRRAAVFSAVTMAFSFKVTELLRFPNALHTAAWYPWILYAFTKIIKSATWKSLLWASLLLMISFIFFLTGGYFYYVFYSLFLFPPYLLLFAIPRLRDSLIGPVVIRWRRVVVALLGSGAIALALCGPYLIKTSSLLKQTHSRSGNNFVFSTEHVFGPIDTLGSLIFPPVASFEGWYYFGILSVLLLTIYFFGKFEPPDAGAPWQPATHSRSLPVRLFFIGWLAVITYITYGRRSYLFIFLWRHFPFFSQLRVWGRLNIILVPIVAWIVALAYARFEYQLSQGTRPKLFFTKRLPRVLLISYALILGTQLVFITRPRAPADWIDHFVKNHIGGQSSVSIAEISNHYEQEFIGFGLLSFFALLILLMLHKPIQSPAGKRGVLAGLLLISALDLRAIGPWLWAEDGQMASITRVPLQISEMNKRSFSTPRIDQYWTVMLRPSFNVGILESWDFDRYVKFLELRKADPQAGDYLLGLTDARKLYFSQSIQYAAIRPFLLDAQRFVKTPFNLESYNGDRLAFSVDAPADGYISFIDNWDPDWKATVDGAPVLIEKLFGTFKSVPVKKGPHRVEFVYRPTL